jgi:P4 family phage/plasmid primase-like protien
MAAKMPRHTFANWLQEHAAKPGKENPFTHTRIGSAVRSIRGGKYYISDAEIAEFNQLYYQHVFVEGREEYLTECQRQVGPLMIDLDFRYAVGTDERQHNEAHVLDTIETYVNIIKSILDLSEVDEFHIWAMEKPEINPQEDLVKDGIHIVIGLLVDRATRKLIRDQAMEDLVDVFEELPLINPMEEIVDKGVCLGTTQWQLYGSRKPGNDAYKMVSAFTVTDGGNKIDVASAEIKNDKAVLLKGSARCQEMSHPQVLEAWKEKHEAAAKEVQSGKKPTKPQRNVADAAGEGLPTSVIFTPMAASVGPNVVGQPLSEVKAQMEVMLDELPFQESHLRDAHAYAMALGPEYYDPRDAWMRVGWALRNTSQKLFGSWVLFSARSKKFRMEDVPEMLKLWDAPQPERKSPLTDRSLAYWCRTSNPEEFERLRQSSIGQAMELSLQGATEFDVATVMHRIFNGEYRCADVKHKLWYQFTGHYWKKIDEGTSLRMQISQYLSPLYCAEVNKLHNMLASMEEGDDSYDRIKKKAGKYNNIAILLKKTSYKNNVMRECCELFYDADFLDKLDQNPLLLGCENGVIDFELGRFRPGLPDDYVSTNCGHIYDEDFALGEKRQSVRDEIVNFMNMLFTEADKNEYMWEHLAAILVGTNENQLFNIYNGEGSNGKSKLVELMTEVLGAYKGTVPVSLVISKRGSIGGVSPEIAVLKPCRYAVMQEPSKGDKLNEGILKELTGGDPIQGRGLYQDTVEFVPQFSLAVCCNEMFEVKSADHGTWRRMGVVNFTSKFTDNPDPNNPLEFKKDKKLQQRFKKWAPVMLVMLAQRAFKNKGEVELCESVKAASNQYRCSQDHIAEFIEERVVVAKNRTLKKNEVWEEFKAWHNDMYAGTRLPQAKDLHNQITKQFGDPHKKNGWMNVGLDDGSMGNQILDD